ncbi:LexA repressor [Halomonas elongata]|uniref:LexA repressor n=1 Tax=Halomonas elongata TaxID=2746 RepID=A0A1B8P072_HALEL|nr:S24 family peptidase [Halomonas elongata]OBX35639.1 LexA repressor [Halomonas elongata]
MDIHSTRYQILRSIMAERHLNLRELSSIIERSESQVSSFAGANPSKNIGERMARHIEAHMNLPPHFLDDPRHLAGVAEQTKVYGDNQQNACVLGDIQHLLPVVGMTTAGKLIDNIADAEIDEFVPAPGPCSEKAFVLRLEGVSMEPEFKSGDRIVIDPGLDWVSGDYVFARRIDSATGNPTGTFKKIVYEEGEYYLCAVNEEWHPRYTRIDGDWQVVGKARYQVKIL